MNLYLDDSISKALLAERLRKAGHQAMLPHAVGLAGADDARHFWHSVLQRRYCSGRFVDSTNAAAGNSPVPGSLPLYREAVIDRSPGSRSGAHPG
jgi:hypothetical protein